MISSLFKCLDRQINSQRKAEGSGEGSRSWLKGWQSDWNVSEGCASALELGFLVTSVAVPVNSGLHSVWQGLDQSTCFSFAVDGLTLTGPLEEDDLDDLCLLRVPELSRAEQLLGSEVLWGQRGTELSCSGIWCFPQQQLIWEESSGGEAWRAQSTEVSPTQGSLLQHQSQKIMHIN